MCETDIPTPPPPPPPFKHFKGFPSSAICPSRVRHGGLFYLSMRVLFSWTQHGPEHEISLRGAPYELVRTLLELMTDVISEGSGEHVCLHNLVRVSSRSLTKFKVDEDSSQIKILYIYTYVVLKILVSGFQSTCNNCYSYYSKTSNSSKWNILSNCWADRGVSVCPHETAHGRPYECITGIMYAQTHIHVPRNKLIVARFCILMNLIFTYLISWNKPVHEIMLPIAYASSEGSDQPAHPRKITSALTAHIHNEGACRGCEFKWDDWDIWNSFYIYHTSVEVCKPTLLHAKISLCTAQSYQHLGF